ncbi:hypothetical protein BGZ47_004399 [Haplosporangium gracile]|nr:hypothetical protein BGZ47_004399 [Haplosporangium gracile]
MYPQPQRNPTLLPPSNSSFPGPNTPPTSRILAAESGNHYQYPAHSSQLYSTTPLPRSEAEFARLERSNRELKQALERTERADRLQSQSGYMKASPVTVPPLFYPICSPALAPAPAASSSRMGESVGLEPPLYAPLQQQQQHPARSTFHNRQQTYLDQAQKGYDSNDEDDSSPPLVRRTKKQRVENPSGVIRDLTVVNLDHVRFQHQGQVRHEMMRSHGVITNISSDTPLASEEDRVSLSNSTHSTTTSNRRSTYSQPFPLEDPLGASYKELVRTLNPLLYFTDSVFTTPDLDQSASGSPELAFVTPPSLKRAQAQQPPLQPIRLATSTDANSFPLLFEQQSSTMGSRIAPTVSAPPRHRSGSYLRVQQQQHQSQETSPVNPQDLIKKNQSKRFHLTTSKLQPMASTASSTGSTTMSPLYSKLRAISGTSNRILPLFTTPASTTKAIRDGVSQYEQERAKVKEKTDRLVIKFKNLPARTDGTGTKKSLKNPTAAITTDDTQTPPRPDGRIRRTATTTPESELDTMVKSDHELEPNAETELEAEESGSQGGKSGRVTER